MIPIKPPECSISQEIPVSICEEYFLQRHIREAGLSGLLDFGELVQFQGLRNAYVAAYKAVAECEYGRRLNNVIFARNTKLSHLPNDVPLAFAVFMKFAATKRTGGRDGEI